MTAAALETLPPGVEQGALLIERLDDCLRNGFARLGPQHQQSLATVAATFADSPLGPPLAEAVAAISRSEFVVRHFSALASARAAVQGAQYDALLAQACDAFGFNAPELEPAAATSLGTAATLLGGAQQWLMEIALAGFQHLNEDSVAPFMATLDHLQAQGELTGLAALLTGYVNELLAHMPAERQASLPVFRWSDLWTAAMIRTRQLPSPTPHQRLDGTFIPFGADVQSHENFVSASIYGLFETEDRRLTVRLPLASYKVDVIAGAEIWELFGDVSEPILKALESCKGLLASGAELWASGDLILKSKPRLGKSVDPFNAAQHITAMPAVAPLYRHPVHLAQPVMLEAPLSFPLATERMPEDTELEERRLKGAQQMIGLLRFDQGGWRVQPLSICGAKGVVLSGESVMQRRAKLKTTTLPVLQERASKLLRAS